MGKLIAMSSLSPATQQLVSQAAFPEQAEHTLLDLLGKHPQLADDIAAGGLVCQGIIAVADISRSLTNALRRNPDLLAGLKSAEDLEVARDRDDYLRLLQADMAADPELDLRRWKRQEVLRLVVRDAVLGADLLAITGEISALADACLCHCLEVARADFPDFPIAILGMGKLGGDELNYASDVDVVFVHGDAAGESGNSDPAQPPPLELAQKVARSVITQMSQHSADGVIFKVDTDLRPEGTAGAISRTPQGFASYFEQRARPWERQAWLKARFVAGDENLAQEVLASARDFVWRPDLDPEEIRYIRDLKINVEDSVAASAGRDYKRGPGGIRDIEFSTQLLLLAHGRSDPMVRSPNTLLALEQLKRAGSIDSADADHLGVAYRYLRNIEHRLQLRDEQAIYEIPADDTGLNWLARVLGYRDDPQRTAGEQFLEQYERHQASVREIEQRLFLRPTLEAVAQVAADMEASLRQNPVLQLEMLGFKDAQQAVRIYEKLTAGISRTARSLAQMMPLMLSALALAPDPDLGLIRFDWITDGPHRANTVIPPLRDSPTCVQRLCQLLGSSKVVAGDLRRAPGFVRDLAEGDLERSDDSVAADARATITLRGDEPDVRRDEVRRFLRRERLRVASRDLLGMAGVSQLSHELTAIADALSEAVLEVLEPEARFCILGMGSVGGQEMLYTSDLDVLFLFEPGGSNGSGGGGAAAQKTAQAWLSEMGTLTPEGRAWEVDVRLRPEGQGAIAHSMETYQQYWSNRARLWEFQALLKARVIAGDRQLGSEFLQAAAEQVYAQRSASEVARELGDMRQRIHAELGRGKRDVKRGPGGRVDVAFAVQLLQLLHGPELPAVRLPNTVEALDALAQAEVLTGEEAALLRECYEWCSQVTNRHYLLTGVESAGVLSDDPEEALHLTRLMAVEAEASQAPEQYGAPEQLESQRQQLMGGAQELVAEIFSRYGAE